MSEEDQEAAIEAWRKADFTPVSDNVEADDARDEIEKAMVAFMRKRFKWSHRELHDALLAAGVAVPDVPSKPLLRAEPACVQRDWARLCQPTH